VPIQAVGRWPTNGHLIADAAALHFPDAQNVFDATYGRGLWWTEWRPPVLWANDLNPETDAQTHKDFRDMNLMSEQFDVVAFDPPYKLNGTPALGDFDDRYGIATPTRWQDRIALILDGARECGRLVKPKGHLLVKCQDQVVSGQMRWVTQYVTDALADKFRLVDRFDMLGGGRPQPGGRTQRHAWGRPSSLLVFQVGSDNMRGIG
jgi:hypothetical protein